jgi:hypothetical protein
MTIMQNLQVISGGWVFELGLVVWDRRQRYRIDGGQSQAGKYGGAIVRMTLFQQMGSWIILSGRKFPWLLCASEVRVGPLDWVW